MTATTPVAAPPRRGAAALREILRDIRFEQTLFSLPFALLTTLLAARGLPKGRMVVLIVLALVSARSAAMAINRVADAALDARNPRTAGRAIPAGRVGRGAMAFFAGLSVAIFLAAAAALNTTCLLLAPIALAFLVGYSWTKRFTALCHVVLGMTLGLAPLGAWVAIRGDLADPLPWLLGGAVAFWVAGFDVLYACPDVDVDRRDGLHSIPKALGVKAAFHVSEGLHVLAVVLLAAAGLVSDDLGRTWWAGLAVASVVLVAEHFLVAPGRYQRMATAFFRLNAVFSIVLLTAGGVDVFHVFGGAV